MPALDPARFARIYSGNLVHPVQANILMRTVVMAVADGTPDAVARYAPDLVPSSSDAARRRPPFAISPLCKSRRAFRVVDGKIEW
eukprot:10304703-Alexandrium_andersonii.AAC.1